jgi:hypothetical protein
MISCEIVAQWLTAVNWHGIFVAVSPANLTELDQPCRSLEDGLSHAKSFNH